MLSFRSANVSFAAIYTICAYDSVVLALCRNEQLWPNDSTNRVSQACTLANYAEDHATCHSNTTYADLPGIDTAVLARARPFRKVFQL